MRPALPFTLALALVACNPADPPAVLRFVEAEIRIMPARPETGEACYAPIGGEPGGADKPTGWIEIPCPAVFTEEFITSLQRALIARDLSEGAATGTIDDPTRDAIRAFQAPLGLDSPTLSGAAAKRLGLIPYDRAELGAA